MPPRSTADRNCRRACRPPPRSVAATLPTSHFRMDTLLRDSHCRRLRLFAVELLKRKAVHPLPLFAAEPHGLLERRVVGVRAVCVEPRLGRQVGELSQPLEFDFNGCQSRFQVSGVHDSLRAGCRNCTARQSSNHTSDLTTMPALSMERKKPPCLSNRELSSSRPNFQLSRMTPSWRNSESGGPSIAVA